MARQRKRRVFHSILTKVGWQVKENGKTVSNHANQAESHQAAMAAGRNALENGWLGQAVLHRKDGRIGEERTYGKDPERRPG
jgi:hypothetical protein